MITPTNTASTSYVVSTLISSAASAGTNPTNTPTNNPESVKTNKKPAEPTTQSPDTENGAARQSADTTEISNEELKQISDLKNIDRQVRAHEAAHMAAGGGLVRGGARYSYQQGPDGRRYAVGGEVSIDTSAVRDDPEATLNKAQRIIAAALAPVNPSSTDRAVASMASQMAAQARVELMAKSTEAQEATNNAENKITAYREASASELSEQKGNFLNLEI